MCYIVTTEYLQLLSVLRDPARSPVLPLTWKTCSCIREDESNSVLASEMKGNIKTDTKKHFEDTRTLLPMQDSRNLL